MGGMKRPPAGSEGSGRGPYVTALFYALGSVLVLFGELFSAEAESAYDSQADKDIADGAGNCAGGGVALRGLAIARLGGGDDRTGFGSGAVCGGPVVLCIATFFAIGSTCCQGAAFGRTLMPVVGTIAGPLGSPLVNMGVVMVRVHGFIVRSTRPSSTSVTDRSSSFLIPTLTSPASAASLTL